MKTLEALKKESMESLAELMLTKEVGEITTLWEKVRKGVKEMTHEAGVGLGIVEERTLLGEGKKLISAGEKKIDKAFADMLLIPERDDNAEAAMNWCASVMEDIVDYSVKACDMVVNALKKLGKGIEIVVKFLAQIWNPMQERIAVIPADRAGAQSNLVRESAAPNGSKELSNFLLNIAKVGAKVAWKL